MGSRRAGSRPLIAITASRVQADRVRGSRWPVCATNDTYLPALRAAGLRPVLVPVGEAIDDPGELVEPFDGVVLPGGGDLAPECYGGSGHDAVYGVDTDRDALELALFRGARQAGLPVLAICRGLQLVNVACGGDLIGHVPDVGGDVVHAARAPEPAPLHPVSVTPGTRLADAVGATEVEGATSLHHQAAGRVGDGLVVTARSADGLVEALEPPADDPWWLVAVQWHPEVNWATDLQQARLFRAFSEAVRNRQS